MYLEVERSAAALTFFCCDLVGDSGAVLRFVMLAAAVSCGRAARPLADRVETIFESEIPNDSRGGRIQTSWNKLGAQYSVIEFILRFRRSPAGV